MKKMLIVSSSLNMGGLEKCLVQFCKHLDKNKYEVDLYLFNEGRILLHELPKEIRLLPDSPYYAEVYSRPIVSGFFRLLQKKQFSLAVYKLLRFLRIRLKKNLNTLSDWQAMKKTMLSISKAYDVAIGFEEGTACYYAAECVNAKVKIGWIHTDIKQIDSNRELDHMAFSKLDHICTVSQNSLSSLEELYPAFTEKMTFFRLPAMLDYAELDRKAMELCELRKEGINIVSVGRLVELKGFHLCIEPLKRLLLEGYPVKWYLVGEGDFRSVLEEKIRQAGLMEHFILLGNQENPYRYIKNADICVQPSSYEGFGIAVWEEKYLQKPVVATNIPSNLEMLKHGENGLLAERTEEAIYQAVKRLVADAALREKLAKQPAIGFSDSLQIMEQLEELFEVSN